MSDLEKQLMPWEKTREEIIILDGCDAKIIDEENTHYIIEFNDDELEIIEGKIEKSTFQNFPKESTPKIGLWFSLINYKDNLTQQTIQEPWPCPRFWNEKLKYF
jgi:hypothetical protein